MMLEGIVEESTGAQVVLRSLIDQSLMIIHRPTEDIMLTKVMPNDMPQEISAENPKVDSSELQKQIKTKLEEVRQPIDDPELQKMNIEELRLLVVERERQIIANKKREHFGAAGAAKMTQYSSPYMPRAPSRSNEKRSAYQPGKLPPWVK
jgi:hypothetical protein